MRASRPHLLGAVLGIIAMFGIIVLSGWHSASIHDHVPVTVASVDHGHDHEAPKQSDGDSSIHLLAHAAGHWIGSVDSVSAEWRTVVSDHSWSFANATVLGGIDPSALLKPPRG